MIHPLYQIDRQYVREGYSVVGIDEAGRGPLAGPVVVGACVLNLDKPVEKLDDSKRLSPKVREELYQLIVENAICWSFQIIDVETIDRVNILQATIHGMCLAAKDVDVENPYYFIDGNRPVPGIEPQIQIIKGDSKSASIAAASIIAKITRDRLMSEFGKEFPEYGFESHFGYGSKRHLEALKKYGVTRIHRRSFSPVRDIIEKQFNLDFKNKGRD